MSVTGFKLNRVKMLLTTPVTLVADSRARIWEMLGRGGHCLAQGPGVQELEMLSHFWDSLPFPLHTISTLLEINCPAFHRWVFFSAIRGK